MIEPDRDESSPLRTPAFFDQGGPGVCYPALHESQIEENRQWHERRAQRVAAHTERVRAHLHRYARGSLSQGTQGKRRSAWCVEMKMRFVSLTDAGRFVNRPPSNILQAIASHNRCGGYHWEYFDPAKHHQQPVAPVPLPSLQVRAAS